MKKLDIKTTNGIIRAISITKEQSSIVEKDLAILYLTALSMVSESYETRRPIPIWFFGLDKWREYLSFFNRTNLIFKTGNSFSSNEFTRGHSESYLITDSTSISKIENLAQDVPELKPLYTAI